jgi:hypothetical protein
MSERHDDKSGEGRQVPPHRSGGSGRPPQEPSSEKVLRDLFERECQDGDKLAEALGVPRTEAGFLNVPKMLAKIRALPSATRCTACGAKEGEPCRGNCERAMPSSTGWISVKDRLPAPEEWVLACALSQEACMYIAEVIDGKWHDVDGGEIDWVYHWMPLPEAPK